MSQTIEWTRKALKDLSGLDAKARQRIVDAVERFGEDGSGNVKALKGAWRGFYRLRVGEYRVIFTLDNFAQSIIVQRVRPRSGSY